MSPMKKRETYTVCFYRNHFFVFTVERPTEEAQCKVDRRGVHTISVEHNVPLEVRSRSGDGDDKLFYKTKRGQTTHCDSVLNTGSLFCAVKSFRCS